MNSTIELSKETADSLVALAQRKGVSVDDLLRSYLPGLAPASTEKKNQAQKIEAFIQWAKGHATGKPLLSDDGISRTAIYDRSCPS